MCVCNIFFSVFLLPFFGVCRQDLLSFYFLDCEQGFRLSDPNHSDPSYDIFTNVFFFSLSLFLFFFLLFLLIDDDDDDDNSNIIIIADDDSANNNNNNNDDDNVGNVHSKTEYELKQGRCPSLRSGNCGIAAAAAAS